MTPDVDPEQAREEQRRLITAIVLSVIVYFVFVQFILEPPKPPVPRAEGEPTETPAEAAAERTPAPGERPAPSAAVVQAEPSSFEQHSEVLSTLWSSLGGGPGGVDLLAYGAADTDAPWLPTWLLNGVLAGFEFEPFRVKPPELGRRALLEDPQVPTLPVGLKHGPDALVADGIHYGLVRRTDSEVAYAAVRDGVQITKTYGLHGGYVTDYSVELRNVGSAPLRVEPAIGVADHIAETEGYYAPKRQTVAEVDGDVEEIAPEKLAEKGPRSYEGPIGWLAIHDKYFMIGVEPVEPAEGRVVFAPLGGEAYAASMELTPVTLNPGELRSYRLRLFTGPMVLSDMRAEGLTMVTAVDYGFFGIIAIPILVFLKFLHGLIGSWGLSIIVLTIVIKAALFPLSQKSYRSMKAMQKLTPDIEALKEKHGEDREKLNQEMMALWKEHGVNPMGGCLPMLLQMPIWFALYRVLWNSVDLYQSEFLYFADLTLRDPLGVFPLLLGVTMFAQQQFTMSSAATMDPMQKKMMQYMPLFFSVIMFTLPAGLVVYILVNNILSIIQQWLIHRGNDDAPPTKAGGTVTARSSA